VRAVFWSSDALHDLNSVIAYIATENPQAALDVINKIEAGGNALGEMATGRKGRVSGTYEKVVAGLPYIMAYAIEQRLDGTERVMILRVIHGARDWKEENWPKG
jgi:toxin ParE1/3/4